MVTNFLDWLLDSNLVIDSHDRNQRGVRTNGGLQQLKTHTTTHKINNSLDLHVLLLSPEPSVCMSTVCTVPLGPTTHCFGLAGM